MLITNQLKPIARNVTRTSVIEKGGIATTRHQAARFPRQRAPSHSGGRAN